MAVRQADVRLCSRDGVVVKREGMRIGRLSPSQMEIRMLEIAVSWSLGYV